MLGEDHQTCEDYWQVSRTRAEYLQHIAEVVHCAQRHLEVVWYEQADGTTQTQKWIPDVGKPDGQDIQEVGLAGHQTWE